MTTTRAHVRRRYSVVMTLVAALSFAEASSRADDAADGRRHAQRASHLAASGKCKQAIAEFDKAIAVLRDPALLFNRGECHRKLGAVEAALEDYNQFLTDLPTAPNRSQVEARIAELNKAAAASAAAPTGGTAAPATAVVATPKAHPKTDPAKATAPAGVVATPAPHGVAGGPTSLGVAPIRGDPAGTSDGPGGTSSLIEASNPQVAAQAAGPGPGPGDSLARRPWFWIALAAVAVGAGVGAFFVFGPDGTTVPPSDLGNYKF